jgi:hypothetical protein
MAYRSARVLDGHRGRPGVFATSRRKVAAGVVVATSFALLLTGFDDSPDLSADSAIFEGLDPAVVQEVLDSPVAFGKVQQMEEDTQASMAQGIVRNFVQCRGAYSAYRSWLTTATAPAVPALSDPTAPVEPSNEATERAQVVIAAAIRSGEPAQLRDFLVGEARCGEWIPVVPGEPAGDTIADAVEALG